MPPKKTPIAERAIAYTPLSEIRSAEANPKLHDLPAVIRSMEKFGFTQPILHDERTGRLVAGHGRCAALVTMKKDGQHPPDGVQLADGGDWLVPVVRGWSSRSDAEAESYLLADNQLTITGGWDSSELWEMLDRIAVVDIDLAAVSGFNMDDMASLLTDAQRSVDAAADAYERGDDSWQGEGSGGGDSKRNPPEVDAADEAVPDVEEVKPLTALGDVWELGPHRLTCGDSTDEAVWKLLLGDEKIGMVLTDPPYGMRLNADYSSLTGSAKSLGGGKLPGKKHENVIGDHEDYDPQPLRDRLTSVKEQFWFGADYYAHRIPELTEGSWLVWDKRKDNQADAIGAEFELCWSRAKHKRRMLRHDWFGFLSSENGADARNRVHPTQKPVTLFADILTQWGHKSDGVVFDPYGGSGSTLIACHKTHRTARLIELDPRYVDVICARWQKLTDIQPIRNGKPWDFLGTGDPK